MSRADDIGLEWDPPLRFRQGGPTRLGGIEIYYDFKWREVFEDGRAQFRNGQRLARLVCGDCPSEKTPALLLTTRTDVDEEPIETDTHFVVVVKIDDYLAQADADAAKSYYATRIGRGITGAIRLHEIVSRADVARAFVESQLGLDDISAWASGNEERLAQLRDIAGVSEVDRPNADVADVVAAVEALDGLDPEIVLAISGLLGKDMDREARIRFLQALTADRTGRIVTSEVIGERVIDRLADARAATAEYAALLAQGSGESALQQFIERNPWLLGLDYVTVRPRRPLPRGQLDFILERYDGFHDLLELKNPQDPIVAAPDEVDGMPPSASDFTLSPDLARALAQIHVYRDILSTDEQTMSTRYGLRNTRDPRVIIVIGQMALLPAHRQRVLRELNRSLHRVEVAPYDLLGDRATAVLDNVERHLSAARTDAGEAHEG